MPLTQNFSCPSYALQRTALYSFFIVWLCRKMEEVGHFSVEYEIDITLSNLVEN